MYLLVEEVGSANQIAWAQPRDGLVDADVLDLVDLLESAPSWLLGAEGLGNKMIALLKWVAALGLPGRRPLRVPTGRGAQAALTKSLWARAHKAARARRKQRRGTAPLESGGLASTKLVLAALAAAAVEPEPQTPAQPAVPATSPGTAPQGFAARPPAASPPPAAEVRRRRAPMP